MRILLTGSSGLLGQAIRDEVTDHDLVATHHAAPADGPTMPVEDADRVAEVVEEADPDWILHAAAWSDVDGCERDPDRAERVNVDGTRNVAAAAESVGARVLLVSTDYVFDGEAGGYRETDPTDPVNVYGETKVAAEQALLDRMPSAVVARPSVIYGPHEPNFVTWVAETLRAGEPVDLVEDQRVSPTYAPHLARQLVALMEADASGIYHTAGADAWTRLEMGRAIADVYGLDADRVRPSRMADLDWDAPRPRDTSLEVSKVGSIAPSIGLVEGLERLLKEM